MKAFNAALSVPWAIRPEALQLILDITSRVHTPDFELAASRLAARRAEVDFGAVSVAPGRPLTGASTARMRGDVAVLPVEGPISRYASFFSEMSGATSIEMLARDFRVALNDPDVSAILLHVDSPGGEVNGTGEFADMLYEARGSKPIWAYVSNEGASAAFWIASACDRVICAPTSLIGSIGVVAAVPDPNIPENKGRVQFVSSQSPKKRPDPTTDAGKLQIQTVIDDIAEQFVSTVARNRGVDADTVLERYGAGDVLVGQKAVDAGLADEVGSFEKALVAITAKPQQSNAITARGGKSEAANTSTGAEEPVEHVENIDLRAHASGTSADRSDHHMNLRERLLAAIQGAPDGELDDAVSAQADATPIAPTLLQIQPAPLVESVSVGTSPTPIVAAEPTGAADMAQNMSDDENRRLREQLAASNAQLARLQNERIVERAETFVARVQTEQRIVPAEAAGWVSLYVQLAQDDGIVALESGSTRIQMLEAALQARPRHMLAAESVPEAVNVLLQSRHVLANSNGATTRTPDGQPISEQRRRELLGMTEIGKQVLNGQSHNGAGRN